MNLRDRVPVEPLAEERLARIERGIVAGLPARRARPPAWRAAVPWAVVAAAAAIALVAWRTRATEPARVDGVSVTAPAPAPTRVIGAAAGERVDLGDAVVTAGAGASFEATRPDGGVLIRLARGRIELDVAPRKGRPPLVVRADDVDVIVVGTRFAVEWTDQVTVEVFEGVVRVERAGAETTLTAGQSWAQRPPEVAATGAPEATDPSPRPRDRPRPRPAPRRPDPADPVDDDLPPLARTLDEYLAMTKKTGAVADEGLYGVARLKGDVRSLDLYLERFPKGVYLDDVLWLRMRRLCTRDRDAACRAAAHRYLDHGTRAKRLEHARRMTVSE